MAETAGLVMLIFFLAGISFGVEERKKEVKQQRLEKVAGDLYTRYFQ